MKIIKILWYLFFLYVPATVFWIEFFAWKAKH